MIKKLLLGLVAIIVILAVVASFQSDEMKVTRSAVIPATPDTIYAVVNDFTKWMSWSPWTGLDPEMKHRLEGPTQGVGAKFHWEGNMECGAGTSHLTNSKLNEFVHMRIDMTRPMEGSTEVQFTFVPEGAGTKVTWAMQGKKPFIGKLIGLFMDCEKMCGNDFEKGLANLAKVVAAGSTAK
jgi:hypothetical protein